MGILKYESGYAQYPKDHIMHGPGEKQEIPEDKPRVFSPPIIQSSDVVIRCPNTPVVTASPKIEKWD